MAGKGGKMPGAGRPKGSRNKSAIEREQRLVASGLLPLDYMLGVMRDETNELAVRIDAAKSAAPYVHPRLAAIEHTGKDGGPIATADLSGLETARRLAHLLSRGAEG